VIKVGGKSGGGRIRIGKNGKVGEQVRNRNPEAMRGRNKTDGAGSKGANSTSAVVKGVKIGKTTRW